MSDKFSDHCKTCALAGACKAKGCILTATALINEHKAEMAELKAMIQVLAGLFEDSSNCGPCPLNGEDCGNQGCDVAVIEWAEEQAKEVEPSGCQQCGCKSPGAGFLCGICGHQTTEVSV